ncbi:hypothetical protein AAJP47_07880 [Psychrobacter sp. B38]|uniref:hypothetical protein n=1 Tax=Psychrobacter sp. B38 TaxID=3143538 RepID=UPI00320FE6FA
MQKGVLSDQKGSYRKSFIFFLIVSACIFTHSSTIKDIPSILFWLALFLAVLKQIVIPINLNQTVFSPKTKYAISDDDFINKYNNIGNPDMEKEKDNLWHRLIIWGERLSSLLFIAGLLYSIFI